MDSDEDNAQNRSPRDHLRRVVMQLAAPDPARAPANEHGKTLAGRWTLIDEFEVEGKRYVLAAADGGARPPRAYRLTTREKQVLALAASGLTNKEIAYELGVTATTVRVLIARAANRLGVLGRHEVIAAFRAIAADDRAPELRTAAL